MTSLTNGINHLGLTVSNLDASRDFFVNLLGWSESGRDESYPRTAVGDGNLRLTLWQADHENPVNSFDRKQNIGLHHVALQVESKQILDKIAASLKADDSTTIEFMPELVGSGPRMHMMCYEPGGNRIEFIWSGITG